MAEDAGVKAAQVNASGEEAGTELVERFFRGQELTLEELQQLASHLFRLDAMAPAVLDAALDEPPVANGIVSRQMLELVLRLIRKKLTPRGSELASAEIELWNQAREWLAICACVNDLVPRRTRLMEAYGRLIEIEGPDKFTRPVTLAWTAAILYRLVTEFSIDQETGLSEWSGTACNALRLLAVDEEDSHRRLRYMSDFCELRLRELKRGRPDDTAVSGPDAEWTREFGSSLAAFFRFDREETPQVRFEDSAFHTLHQVAVGQYDNALQLADACAELATMSPGSIDMLDTLFEGMVVVVRARMLLGLPATESARHALLAIRAEVLRYRVKEDWAKNVRWKSGMDLFEQMKKQAPPAPVDEALAAAHIDELLGSGAGERRGIALSGGGLRAACFHIGVLAYLAECDDLRRIDMFSCVSGGSIAGAAFAVRTRALLATKFDTDIDRQDYVDIVRDLATAMTHLAGSNLRMRALASPWSTLRMCLQPGYTYTERIAELLDAELFVPLMRTHPAFKDKSVAQMRRLPSGERQMTKPGGFGLLGLLSKDPPLGWPLAPWDLGAPPRGEAHDFQTNDRRNLFRHARCPEVIINTTSINTGAAFLVTTRAHGERPDPYASEISSRPRMPWMPYSDITAGAIFSPGQMKLSRMVAASASVPGLIPPVLLRRVHQEVLVTLADGGVVDNQGLHSLVEAGCAHILLSDASGQLGFDAFPEAGNLPLMTRSSDILMERVRELGYKQLIGAKERKQLQSLSHVHLTKELSEAPPLAIFRADDALRHAWAGLFERSTTSFGVVRRCQGLLARLRTDLDCFSQLEIYGLMMDGYMQATKSWSSSAALPPSAPPVDWPFMVVGKDLKTYAPQSRMFMMLEVGQYRTMRLPRLLWRMLGGTWWGRFRWMLTLLAAAAVGAGGFWAVQIAPVALVAFSSSVVGAALIAVGLVLIAALMPPSGFKRWFTKLLFSPILLIAMFFAWSVVWVADPVYRRLGKTP